MSKQQYILETPSDEFQAEHNLGPLVGLLFSRWAWIYPQIITELWTATLEDGFYGRIPCVSQPCPPQVAAPKSPEISQAGAGSLSFGWGVFCHKNAFRQSSLLNEHFLSILRGALLVFTAACSWIFLMECTTITLSCIIAVWAKATISDSKLQCQVLKSWASSGPKKAPG